MLIQSIRNKALTLLAGMAIVCVGCHHSDVPCPPDEPAVEPAPDMVNLCLKVSFDGQKEETRADKQDQDGYESADGVFENINSLRVIIIRYIPEINEDGDTIKTDDGKPKIAQMMVEANRLVATNENGHPKNDNLEFNVVDNENKRIYLIANESSLKSPSGGSAMEFLQTKYSIGNIVNNFDELTNWTISMPDISEDGIVSKGLFSDTKDFEPKLPLTEFFDIFVNVKRLNLPDDTYKTNLFMTRAAAKATFYLDPTGLDPAYKNVRITSISLTGIGADEYVFPNDAVYSKGKYQDTPKPDLYMYISDFKTPSERTLTYLMDNLNIDMVPDGNTGTEPRQITEPIYFPESILQAGQKYTVTVTLSTGAELTGDLTDNILSIGNKDAVSRNTHLQIRLGFEGKELSAEVRVAPYIGIDLDPTFGSDLLIKPPKPRTATD